MDNNFTLFTAVPESVIWDIMEELIKGQEERVLVDRLDLMNDSALDYSIENNLEMNEDLPNIDELSNEQLNFIYDVIGERLATSRVLNVDFKEKEWDESSRDVNIEYEFDFKGLVESALKECPNKDKEEDELEK